MPLDSSLREAWALEERARGIAVEALRSAPTQSFDFVIGTQKAHRHEHFIGISLPYWASSKGGFYGISIS